MSGMRRLAALALAACAQDPCPDTPYAVDDPECVITACDESVAAARTAARADAPACVFRPERLEKTTCGGNDRSPELGYYAVWCSEAELSCIRADPDLDALCFGG